MGSSSSAFYLGKYLVDFDPYIDRDAYCLPGLPDIKETSNVEDLLADPEAFDVLPLEAQGGCDEWSTDTSTGSGDFTGNSIPNFAFYNFYLGPIGRGRFSQSTPIAISDFYTVSIESGSPAGSRIILDFC